jgi:hypothetical protein
VLQIHVSPKLLKLYFNALTARYDNKAVDPRFKRQPEMQVTLIFIHHGYNWIKG